MAFGGFGGFSAIPQGFQTGVEGQKSELDLLGTQAFGRALQLMFSGARGGQPPQAPMPGQPSMPAGGAPGGQPGMTPLPPWSAGGPGPPGGPPPAGPMPPRPPMPGAPGAQPPAPQASPGMPPAGGMPSPGGLPGSPGGQQGPALDLQTVIGSIVKSNPGANPAVIASAVNRFIPLMNSQSQQQWREMSLLLREQAIQQAEYFKSITASQAERRTEQGERRTEQGEARVQQGAERVAQGAERVAQGAERVGIAKGESERKTRQGDERIAQAQQRIGIAKDDLKRKFAADAERKKQGEGRLAILQKQYDLAKQRNDLAGQRMALQAMHMRAQEIINEWAQTNKIDKKLVDQILEENRKYYRDLSDNLGKPEAPKTPDRAPAGTPIPGQQPAIP